MASTTLHGLTVEDLLGRLKGVRRSGAGHVARCPAHEDHRASMTVGRGADGRLLVHCHAGCPPSAIAAAIGLELADLFAPETRATGRSAGKAVIVATYPYRDEHGTVLSEAVRFEPKDFLQRRPTASGDYVWNVEGVRNVVYRLDVLHRDRPAAVFIPEGERDVETLVRLGLPATCNRGGAGKWTPDLSQQLTTCGVKRAALLPDNDDPGRAHVQTVAELNAAVGIESRILTLPGLAPKADVTDWVAAGGTPQALRDLARATPAWAPSDALGLVTVGTLLSEPAETVDYLVADRLPSGSVNLLAGRPKGGKSTLARALGAAVATGREWLGQPCRPGNVVYIVFEDKRSEVRKHLRQLGLTGDEPFRLLFGAGPRDLHAQLTKLAARERIDLLIIDTAQRFLRTRDSNDYSEVSAAFEPIVALARDHGTCVVLVHHAGKVDRVGIDAVLGSTAWASSVDNVLLLNRTERYRVFSTIQRIGPDLGETVVTLNPETGALQLAGSRYLVDIALVEGAIVDELAQAGQPVTRADLLASITAKRQLKLAALRKLTERGAIARGGGGKKGSPYSYSMPAESAGGSSGAGPESGAERLRPTDSNADSLVPYRAGNQKTTTTTTSSLLENQGNDSGSSDTHALDSGPTEAGREPGEDDRDEAGDRVRFD